ncbi:MAG: lipopolysaccharide kinase InaA family protein [Phycisphaerae bacterium]|nr:lipopolysaccharide kinase InaA family protein [Phycisphaerae bacterium]
MTPLNDKTLDPAVDEFVRQQGLDTVVGAFAYEGGDDLSKPGLGHRRRTRLSFTDSQGSGREMYMKRYAPLPLARRLRRFFTGRASQSEARTEFENIRAVRLAGVPTMREIVYGVEKDLLGVKRSYIIVGAVPGDALERVGEEFVSRRDADLDELTDRLVKLVRRLHEAGFVHRDLYAAHIFLHEHSGGFDLNLIDLARIFKPSLRKFRWRVKDLAQLKYSMPRLWVERCWERFLAGYLNTENRAALGCWERAISAKVRRMQRRDERKARKAGRKEGS